MVLDDAFLDYHRTIIAENAIDHRLPTVFGYRLFVDGGGLMPYGPDLADMFRRSAKIVDRILKGAKPGDLPVEQPVKFQFVINLRTMHALGISSSQRILERADDLVR
jgi:putative tryptophan/tyrosine transport system substrate-binding protein